MTNLQIISTPDSLNIALETWFIQNELFGGMRLAREPKTIILGKVIRDTERDFALASHREAYGLEYGNDSLEIQQSTLPKGARILLIDDVLATGGTLIAANKLLKSAGFEVCGALTLLEIAGLNGSRILQQNGIPNKTLIVA